MKKHLLLLIAAIAVMVLATAAFIITTRRAPTTVVTNEPIPQTSPDVIALPTESATLTLEVKWTKPVAMAPVDIFSATYKGEGVTKDPLMKKNYENRENYLRVGTVVGGVYDGAAVVIVGVTELCSMGGTSINHHFLVPKAGAPVMLAAHSPWYSAQNTVVTDEGCVTFDASKLVVDTGAFIPDLRLPEKLTRGTSTFSLTLSSFWNAVGPQVATPMFDPKNKVIAFTDPIVGDVYKDAADAQNPMYGFYVAAPDGTIRTYILDIPFYDIGSHIPDVRWTNGSKNADEYWNTEIGGCGMRNLVAVVEGAAKKDLKAIGTTSQGDSIYTFADPNHLTLKNLYDESYSLGRGDDKMSYEAFVASNPIFLWYDSFGRLIRFLQAAFLPNAECGKPVIYLYPEQTTDISVKLAPQGGFTKSEPAYDGGWQVRATPKGELTNLKDGKTYPYLFWEGRGGLYETPKQGFVVTQKDVHGFLVEKLSALGLNAQERADFIEFWEPRMTGSPYYFVTFLGNRAMDALAPMNVTPKPETVIRILMDFLPLEKPIQVEGFTIHTPQRHGFTVVEWGGVLR